MKEIEIKTVNNLKDLKQFIQFHYDLYRECPQAVPFLYSDEMNTLRDGFIFVGKLIRIEFANEPGWVLKCYHALKYSILADEHSPVGDSVNAGPNELEDAAVRAITNGNSLAKRCVA